MIFVYTARDSGRALVFFRVDGTKLELVPGIYDSFSEFKRIQIGDTRKDYNFELIDDWILEKLER